MTAPLPRFLTVTYILANATGIIAYESAQEDNAVDAFLAANGVAIEETDTSAERQAAATVLKNEKNNFWVKHWTLHPNYKRCKNWLWVHTRYRCKARAILASVQALHEDNPGKAHAAAKKVSSQFNKFQNKIIAHSEFEDTHLFKAFSDEHIGGGEQTSAVFNRLIQQHSEIKLVGEIQSGLDSMGKEADSYVRCRTEVIEKMADYVRGLEAHLDQEENAVVCLWLQLTPEQYKKYRKNLSWKYAMVY